MARLLILCAVASVTVMLAPAAVRATPPTHTTQHVDTEYTIDRGGLCTFPVGVHSVGDNAFTFFDNGAFIAHASFNDTYTNVDTRSVVYVRGSYTTHLENSAPTIGRDTGAFLQIRDVLGRLLAEYSGQLAFDFSPGAPGITKVTPNATALIAQNVICTFLS